MAFVDALSDLFSCGRSRKTRENSTAAEDAINAIPQIPQSVLPEHTHQETDVPAADAPHQVHDFKKNEKARPTEGVPDELRADTENTEEHDNATAKRNRNDRVAVVEEKAKQSGGWMVERRVLVTSTPSITKDTAPVSNVQPEPVPETHEEVAQPERSPTPELETSQAVSSAHPFLPEPEAFEALSFVTSATPVPEVHEENSVKPTPEPEKVNPSVPVQMSKMEAPVSVPEMPEPEVEELMTEDVQIIEQTPPVGLLDLPLEVRSLIYEQMGEEQPIRMCRHDDPALALSEGEPARVQRRQFYNFTQVCHQIREEFLPKYAKNTEYIIDLWTQKTNLAKVDALKGGVSMDIDAACFDMEPIDLLPLIRCLSRKGRTDCRFASTEGVVFRSIQAIVDELNKLLPGPNGSNNQWLDAISGPMKRVDLHLFPHEDVRQYYRFRGAEPLVRIVYPSAASEEWMKRSSKSEGYETYLEKSGLGDFEMHVVVGHASRRITNEGRLPHDWRMSLQLSRFSIDRTPRTSMDVVAARMSGTFSR